MTKFNFLLQQRLTNLTQAVEASYEHFKIVYNKPIPDEFEFELRELRLQLDNIEIPTTLKMGNLYKLYDKILKFKAPQSSFLYKGIA